MGFVSVLSFAHQLLSQKRVHPGDKAIDATLGNGNDVLLLAKLTGNQGRVYGFDIQRNEIPDASSFVQLHLCSHADMEAVIPPADQGSIAAVTFNLGYLPGAEQDIITQEASTLSALEASLRMLRKGGIVTIVLYTGHSGGSEEAQAVEAWAMQLSAAQFQVLRYQFINRAKHAPYLLAVEKR
jgi:predicted methyltransferase